MMTVLAYITGHKVVNCHQRPLRSLINRDARRKIADAPLALISMIGQRACPFLLSV